MGLREKYLKAIEEIEKYYAFPDKHREIMKIIPLVRNGIFLIFGPYGYGKTVYADLIGKTLFGGDGAKVNLNSELTIHDVFFWIDAGKLAKGIEVIEPRKIITAPFKFINELQRGNGKIYNTLLSLMSEKTIVYRDKIFKTPEFVMLMDANPFDSASVEIPRALLDRITGSFTMLTPNENEREKLMYLEHATPIDMAKSILSYNDMKKIWKEMEKVIAPDDLKFLLLHLIHNYLNNCIHGDKEYFSPEIMRSTCTHCRWKHEPCSELLEPLGERWWIDTIKVAKARAYLDGRNEISIDDILSVLPYILSHRVHLREDILIAYRAPELWADKLVRRIKIELESRWIPALNGNERALRDAERTLNFLRNERGVKK